MNFSSNENRRLQKNYQSIAALIEKFLFTNISQNTMLYHYMLFIKRENWIKKI